MHLLLGPLFPPILVCYLYPVYRARRDYFLPFCKVNSELYASIADTSAWRCPSNQTVDGTWYIKKKKILKHKECHKPKFGTTGLKLWNANNNPDLGLYIFQLQLECTVAVTMASIASSVKIRWSHVLPPYTPFSDWNLSTLSLFKTLQNLPNLSASYPVLQRQAVPNRWGDTSSMEAVLIGDTVLESHLCLQVIPCSYTETHSTSLRENKWGEKNHVLPLILASVINLGTEYLCLWSCKK